MNSRDKLYDYRYRLNALERELTERKIKSVCEVRVDDTKKEYEKSEAFIREEEKLKRLKESGNENFFPEPTQSVVSAPISATEYIPFDYELELQRKRTELEAERLKFLQDQVNRQIEENMRLKERILYRYPHPAPYYYGVHSGPTVQVPPQEVKHSDSAMDEVAVTVDDTDDEDMISVSQGSVVFDGNSRLTFSEAYALLSPVQKHFCDGLLAYACKQSGAERRDSKFHVSIGCGFNQVIKVSIKNNIVIVCARMEDSDLRKLRLSDTDTPIKTRETTIKVVDNGAYETAKRLVDLRIVQITEYIDYKKQLRSEKRKAAWKAKKGNGSENIEKPKK